MSTYTQILYQIVFTTKHREPVLLKSQREQLFRVIWGITEKNKCRLYRINGVNDHLHILMHVHPSVSLAWLVRDIKLGSSYFIRENGLFPGFKGWQDGYGAFTYHVSERDRLIDYVKNQEVHHHGQTFIEEYKDLLNEHGISFEEKYLI